MSAVAVENLMALLYTNTGVRKSFIANPSEIMADFDLDETERNALLNTDWPGLVLAGNGFGYKRWKSNQWRHSDAYIFTSYDSVFDESDIAPLRVMFTHRIEEGKIKNQKLRSTHAGVVGDILKTMPENQINHEHVLLENPKLTSVISIWQKLYGLNLNHHYLIRAYFYRATLEAIGVPESLHARPGACNTYIPLSPALESGSPAGYITALMNDGQTISKEPLIAGRFITFPADVAQRIDAGEDNPNLQTPIDVLCIKTLCAAV
jgi:hypothetical protein